MLLFVICEKYRHSIDASDDITNERLSELFVEYYERSQVVESPKNQSVMIKIKSAVVDICQLVDDKVSMMIDKATGDPKENRRLKVREIFDALKTKWVGHRLNSDVLMNGALFMNEYATFVNVSDYNVLESETVKVCRSLRVLKINDLRFRFPFFRDIWEIARQKTTL